MDYSKTVNLLQTDFPMKADLPVREPEMLKSWDKARLYEKIQEKNRPKPIFLLHDGPPYANGEIHMGHALNKVLKDFVVKYKTLAGFSSPYKPGWDCHGLPIEHQLFKQLGKSKHQVSRTELRAKATDYAMTWVDKQRADFIRLGVLGDWQNPYLTLSNDYEASIVQTFFDLQDQGFVYRGLKPGYWCAYDETALAEAEVEYAEKKSDSVYVRFKVKSESLNDFFRKNLPQENTYVLIWTTTPWTLPANQGLAFHPKEKYVLLEKDGDNYIVAEKLQKTVAEKIGAKLKAVEPLLGTDFSDGLRAVNPITGADSIGVWAHYVTMEDGTGIVHIAPGHGVEDFSVGQEFGLKTISPVNEKGCFDATVGHPDLIGKHVLKDANDAVMKVLGKNLVYHQPIKHSYPHCWRCKNPIIFRATEQWFLRIDDKFRNKLLSEIDRVQWEPSYGVHRIKGMVETRPDWCLSRQRHWGAPIAVLTCKKCKTPLKNKSVNSAIVELIAAKGATTWYETAVDDFLKPFKVSCASCKASEFERDMDILDVWFDSGVSWHAVVEKYFSKPKPETVMYLEGSDQHRGWFQTSLIPSAALKSKAPYDVVLTHGFVVDGKGHKMSKSLGNVIAPQEIIEKLGADILRLWVAMSDYREDVRLSQDIIKHMVDVYRRFRNTFRFLLQNTADFKWSKDRMPFEKMEEVDRWALGALEEMKARVIKAYDAYEFHVVLSELNRFASVTLSGFYLDAIKDILYCESPTSPKRRSSQSALAQIMRGMSVLLAPLLSFTSEEAYRELRATVWPELPESVFLDELGQLVPAPITGELQEKWNRILEIRGLVNDELDKQRKTGVVKSSQEAAVHVNPGKLSEAQKKVFDQQLDWPFLLQMAEIHRNGVEPGSSAVSITATQFSKCERCWRHRADVGKNKAHPTLCARCCDVVQAL